MKKIVFVIDQNQDLYYAVSIINMLKESPLLLMNAKITFIVTSQLFMSEIKSFSSEFDELTVIGKPRISFNSLRTLIDLIRFKRSTRYMKKHYAGAVVVAFSFREFFMNVLIRSFESDCCFIAIRKCDYDADLQCTREKRIIEFHRNIYNSIFGFSAMNYRWHPKTDRLYTYFFRKNPYSHTFCLKGLAKDCRTTYEIPYPFPVLRNSGLAESSRQNDGIIIILGEIYPLYESQDINQIKSIINALFTFLRNNFPDRKLIFKPRRGEKKPDLDFTGIMYAYEDVSLEFMLTSMPMIEKVISFKSSGSFIASSFGIQGYLLYKMLDWPNTIRESLDSYFKNNSQSTIFVENFGDLYLESDAINHNTQEAVSRSYRFLLKCLNL